MKIKEFKLQLIWEDGTVNDVSNYIPDGLQDFIDVFIEHWEEKYGEDDDSK
jgi:hypothetical protein